jgi:hypothetical protein
VVDLLTSTDAWLENYYESVKEHRESIVIPWLGKWMNEELPVSLDYNQRQVVQAVHDVYRKIGLRERNSASAEAVGRQIRDKLEEYKVGSLDLMYWSEIGVQMYFNPPYSVKAANKKIEGFQ